MNEETIPLLQHGEYDGEWEDGQPHGVGKWRSFDGSEVYEGGFENGDFHGQGVLEVEGKDEYQGIFENGELARGVAKWRDGSKFVGDFIQGEAWKGEYTNVSGAKSEGSFLIDEQTDLPSQFWVSNEEPKGGNKTTRLQNLLDNPDYNE